MNEEGINTTIEEWVRWGNLCVVRAREHLHDHRIFAIEEVQDLLRLKEQDPWNLSMGKALFDLWSGKKSQEYKWSGPEWHVMQALYHHACGPLPVSNFEIDREEFGKVWSSSRVRRKIAFLSDLMAHVKQLVEGLSCGVPGILSGITAENQETLDVPDLDEKVIRIRQDLEDLFPGDFPDVPSLDMVIAQESVGKETVEEDPVDEEGTEDLI